MRRLPTFLLVPMLTSAVSVLASDMVDPAGGPMSDRAVSFASAVQDAPIQATSIKETLIPDTDSAAPGEVVPTAMSYEAANWQQEPAPAEYFTLGELQEEMKKIAWVKGENKIVPYGVLWGSAAYDTARTNPGAYTLFVHSPDQQGEGQFVIDTRRTRVGLDVTGPQIPLFDCATLGGKVEIDFHGAFQSTENKAGILFRHGYGEIKNDNFRLLAGQTWDLISPLYPGTLSYTVGWVAGNIGYRRMQVRMERYLHPSDDVTFEIQGALAQDIVSDFTTTADVAGEPSDWPVIQARAGVKLANLTDSASPISLGVSGHIGEQQFDFTPPRPPADDYPVRTWSLNLDVRVPLTNRMGIQGEFFTGENLGTFLGGIAQGVDLVSRQGIRSTGGWVDVWYDLTPKWHSHAGYSIDDPNDNDLNSAAQRKLNQFFFVNTSYDVTKNMNLGVELTNWKTLYVGRSEGEAVRIEFVGRYSF